MTVFVCEDSLDGILTGVYEAWDSRLGHANVRLQIEGEENLELFCTYRPAEPQMEKARKVFETVQRRLGEETLEAICEAAASNDKRKADAIYRVIVLGLHLEDGRQVMNCIQNEAVSLVARLQIRIWHESHRLMGFLRFQELENRVLYARLESPYGVLPFVAPHFADRFRQENWMIHDIKRGLLAVHPRNEAWILTEAEQLNREALERFSVQEEEFQKLWQSFCQSIAIEQRESRKLQQSLLPLRFRGNMTEFPQTLEKPGAVNKKPDISGIFDK